jgi:Ser/Thr protein kinase RdoA (MazF antagonist)
VIGRNRTVTDLLVNSNSSDYRKLGKFVGNLHKSLKDRKDLIRDNFEETYYKNSLYYRLGFLNVPEIDNLISDLYELPKHN